MEISEQPLTLRANKTTTPSFFKSRICPTCKLESSSTVTICPQDGTELVELPASGRMLADKYEFITEIGAGGMGVIYKARQIILNKMVAIKMLHRLDEKGVMRFQQEAQASSRLQHPNIVSVVDFGVTEQGQPYMVMDYLEGLTLSELIKKEGALPVQESVDIFIQICEGMSDAHKNHVLHRDLKTSNIMLTKLESGNPLVKILDFGIAKFQNGEAEAEERKGLTQTGEIFGSPLYISPEQAMGQKIDRRSDIYSLGCIMYETLTGGPPLAGMNVIETIFKQINEVPQSLKYGSLGREFSKDLEDVVATTLAKDPQQRFDTMDELKAALLHATGRAAPGFKKREGPFAPSNHEGKSKQSTTIYGFDIKTLVLTGTAVLALTAAVCWFALHNLSSTVTVQKDNPQTVAMDKIFNAESTDSKTNSLTASSGVEADTSSGFLIAPESLTIQALKYRGRNGERLDLPSNRVLDSLLLKWKEPLNYRIINVRSSRVSDAGLKKLVSYYVRELDIGATNVTDKGLSELKRAPNLSILHISHLPAVTDAGLQNLRALRHLKILKMNDLDITDEGMKNLASLSSLEELSLCGTKITDQGLAVVARLPNLHAIDLGEAKNVTDKSLTKLATAKNLAEINLESTKITDKGLAMVAHLPLENLRLNRTRITGAGLDALKDCRTLARVVVTHCRYITEQDVEKFKKDHPTCIICRTRKDELGSDEESDHRVPQL